jgi:phage FluMu protein Com
MREVRCSKCNKLAGRFSGEFDTVCHRCGTKVAA